LEFLNKRTEDDNERIKKTLYSEMAGWLLFYLEDAAKYINNEELKELIADTLSLPRFKLAREFYLNNPENWEAANLLRKADINEYIDSAIKPTKNTLPANIIQAVKIIYKHI